MKINKIILLIALFSATAYGAFDFSVSASPSVVTLVKLTTGSNTRPAALDAAALSIAKSIGPLNPSTGLPDSNGKYVLVSIGLSNTRQEFDELIAMAKLETDLDPKLVIVNGADGGMTARRWADEEMGWDTVNSRLSSAGVTPQQVSVVWLKVVNTGCNPTWVDELYIDYVAILQKMKTKYLNAKLVYFSSRATYHGDGSLNPEPCAYESAFAIKKVIEAQQNGDPNLNWDPSAGAVKAPLVVWGSYFWADRTNARSDGLRWDCVDFPGIHPSDLGRSKVANMLLDFFRTDTTAKEWFLASPPASDATPPSVSVTSPAAGSTVSGTITLSATASDNVGVIGVQFTLNGTKNIGAEDTTAPYSVTFDTNTVPDGGYAVVAIARDAAGNNKRSIPITMIVRTSTCTNSAPTGNIPLIDMTSGTYKGFLGLLYDPRSSITSTLTANLVTSPTAQVDLSVSGLPSGVTATFVPSFGNPTYTSTLYLSAIPSATTGTSPITIIGKSGTLTKTAPLTLTVSTTGDITPPTVSITSPANGATVLGTTTVTATATDNIAVAQVEFYVDSVLKVIDSTAPYSFSWDTTKETNAVHTIMAKAIDTSGNSNAHSITVTVNNVGSFDFTLALSPTSGSVIQGGSTSTSATATLTGTSIKSISFSCSNLPTDASCGFTPPNCNPTCSSIVTITTAGTTPSGSYAITVSGTDGTITRSAIYTLTVNPSGDTPPTVTITSPADGATVSGDRLNVQATASDNIGISKVEFYIDGNLKKTDTTSLYNYVWDTTSESNALHEIIAKAYDTAGLTSTHTIIVTVNNPVPFDFSLTLSPTSATVTQGGSATTSATATLASGATTQTVTFSCTVSPAGPTCTPLTTSCSPTCTSTLNIATATTPTGTYTITLTGTGGSITRTASYTLTVTSTDNILPTLTITNPTQNKIVFGTVIIDATATDNVGISKAEFYIDSVLKSTDTVSPYSYSWDTLPVSNSTHTIMVKAYDAAGNSNTYSVTVIVDNGKKIADVNNDGAVNLNDIVVMILSWSLPGSTDINKDGTTNLIDVGILLSKWTG